jgi:hypothetical protein
MKTAVVVAMGLGLGAFLDVAGQGAAKDLFGSYRQIRSTAALNAVASELNKSLPMMVDRETELMHVNPGEPGVIVYHYRLLNLDAWKESPRDLVDRLRPEIVTRVCTTPSTGDGLLRRGVRMRFAYVDRYRYQIAAFDVSSDNCRFGTSSPPFSAGPAEGAAP